MKLNKNICANAALLTVGSIILSGCSTHQQNIEPTPSSSTSSRPMEIVGVAMQYSPKRTDTTKQLCTLGVSRGGNVSPVTPPMTACFAKSGDKTYKRDEPVDSSILLSICFKQEGGYALMKVDKEDMQTTATVWDDPNPFLNEQLHAYMQNYVDVVDQPGLKVDGIACAQKVDAHMQNAGNSANDTKDLYYTTTKASRENMYTGDWFELKDEIK